jgi:uncharacterized repeat protein (TIGR03803 family)
VAQTSRLLFFLACAGAIASAARAQTFSVLHTFQYFPHGASPYAPLYRNSSGDLYGTTNGGGQYNAGVVFKLDSAGNQTVLHTFTGGTDGGNPCAGVVMDPVGNLYGTAYQGGIAGAGVNKRGAGVVYKIDTGGQYSVLYSFTGGADGSGPFAGVILDSAGNLYGTTYNGGVNNLYGVVYKLSPSGQETVLYSFKGAPDGANPYAGVVMDAAGYLYGTTYGGGGHSAGAVYKVTQLGKEAVLYSFGSDGTGPPDGGGVILDPAGNLYGAGGVIVFKLDPAGHFTQLADLRNSAFPSGLARDASGNLYFATQAEGTWPDGAVFKLDTSGRTSLLYKFKGAVVQSGIGLPVQNAGVVLDSAGNLYGTTPFQGTAGIVYEIEASGTVKRLYDFLPGGGGYDPSAGLTLDAAGNLHGTTAGGGGQANAGVVYKMGPGGRETVLYTFKGGSTDGANPGGNVVLDQAGNLYGTTATGGADSQGVVYKLTPSGQETILHSFTGGADGAFPTGLALDSAGNLYGTAAFGGAGSQTGLQEGVVFKLDTAGNFSVVYSFTGLSDGGVPDGGVVLDAAGNLYGTTYAGGLGYPGAGVVFKIDTTGAYSVLHAFLASTDGGYPRAGVTLDAAGNIYGTCPGYGPHGGGTVFRLDASANFTLLYAFAGGSTAGSPIGGVVRGAAGDLYGAISAAAQGCPGTAGSCGMLYRIDTSGKETVLYDFSGGSDGADPITPVTLDGAGRLYGVATGDFAPVHGGVAFKITLP